MNSVRKPCGQILEVLLQVSATLNALAHIALASRGGYTHWQVTEQRPDRLRQVGSHPVLG